MLTIVRLWLLGERVKSLSMCTGSYNILRFGGVYEAGGAAGGDGADRLSGLTTQRISAALLCVFSGNDILFFECGAWSERSRNSIRVKSFGNLSPDMGMVCEIARRPAATPPAPPPVLRRLPRQRPRRKDPSRV